MKLFVKNKSTGQKIYLSEIAPNRAALALAIGSPEFTLFDGNYHVNEVTAEATFNSTAAGGVLGGLIGSAIEPGFGTLIGGAIGGLFGNRIYSEDLRQVNLFNKSYYIDTTN